MKRAGWHVARELDTPANLIPAFLAEHQHRVLRRPAAFGPVRAIEHRVQLWPNHFEIDHRRQPLEWIARCLGLTAREQLYHTLSYLHQRTIFGRFSWWRLTTCRP